MSIWSFANRPDSRANKPPRGGSSIVVLGFERICCRERGTIAGGMLTYLHGPVRCSVFVGLTWDALARLRAELVHAGLAACDELIISRCLKAWGGEQVRVGADEGRNLPLAGLVLGLDGGPASNAPVRLLTAAGLLCGAPAAAGEPPLPTAKDARLSQLRQSRQRV